MNKRDAIFLPGCGVDYVHWLPSSQVTHPAKQLSADGTPVDVVIALRKTAKDDPNGARHGGRLLRLHKCLIRFAVKSWEQLEQMEAKDFRKWRNYGVLTHSVLTALAAERGYSIAKF
jgi:hypothetical protein